MDSSRRDAFWAKHRGLVWSNSKASDSVMIMAALTRERFHEILAICEEFGLNRVRKEWKLLQTEGVSAAGIEMVSSILDNLAIRFKNAQRADSKRLAGVVRQAGIERLCPGVEEKNQPAILRLIQYKGRRRTCARARTHRVLLRMM